MAQIHDLLSDIGRQQTLQLGIDRRVIDAAAGYLSAEDNETSFLFSGWTYTSFPHRRLADDASWDPAHRPGRPLSCSQGFAFLPAGRRWRLASRTAPAPVSSCSTCKRRPSRPGRVKSNSARR